MTYFLTLEDIGELGIAVMAAEQQKFMVADVGLLQSALARPRATAFGKDAYPSLAEKAAALLESLARNHCLIDGNKRLAWSATKLFLLFNDLHLQAVNVDDAEQFVLAVAQGHVSTRSSAATLLSWSTPITAGI